MGYYGEMDSMVGASVTVFVIMMIAYLLSFGLMIATYILQSLGMYTIAQRRGIKHPWMAWLPLTNMWILGSISDQYRYVALGQVRNRRKVLLAVGIAAIVLYIVLICIYVGFFVNLMLQMPVDGFVDEGLILDAILPPIFWMLGVLLVMWVVAIVGVVFQYMCLYDLYASCNPENKVLFLVLSIIVNITLPFFVFACRKKDGGMPPRKEDALKALPAEPQTTEPRAAEPQEAEPQAAEPRAAEPQEAEPQAAEPQEAEPQAVEPQEAEPQEAEPQEAEPQETVE